MANQGLQILSFADEDARLAVQARLRNLAPVSAAALVAHLKMLPAELPASWFVELDMAALKEELTSLGAEVIDAALPEKTEPSVTITAANEMLDRDASAGDFLPGVEDEADVPTIAPGPVDLGKAMEGSSTEAGSGGIGISAWTKDQTTEFHERIAQSVFVNEVASDYLAEAEDKPEATQGDSETPAEFKALDDEEQSFLTWLWHSWVQVLFSPREFFAKPSGPNEIRPALFILVIAVLSVLLSGPQRLIESFQVVDLDLGNLGRQLQAYGISSSRSHIPGFSGWLGAMFASLAFRPFFMIYGAVFTALSVVFSVRWYGGNISLRSAFEVFSFASAPFVLVAIPHTGGLLALGLAFVIAVLGVSERSGLSPFRAAVATLAPLALVWTLTSAAIVSLLLTFAGSAL